MLLPLSPAVGTRWDGAVPGGWKGSGHVPMSPPVLRAGGLWVMCEDGETGLCVSSPAGCGGATHIPAGEGAGTGQSVSLREGRTPQAQAPHVPPGDRVPSCSSRGQSLCCALGHWGCPTPGGRWRHHSSLCAHCLWSVHVSRILWDPRLGRCNLF